MSHEARTPEVQLAALYTALAEAVGRAGDARTPLLLATLSLDLLSHADDATAALEAIARAERLAAL